MRGTRTDDAGSLRGDATNQSLPGQQWSSGRAGPMKRKDGCEKPRPEKSQLKPDAWLSDDATPAFEKA